MCRDKVGGEGGGGCWDGRGEHYRMLLARNRACDRAHDSHDSVRSVRALCMRPTYDNALHRAPFGPLFMGIVKKKKSTKRPPGIWDVTLSLQFL